MITLTLTEFEANLIAAVRALPDDRRAVVLHKARAAGEIVTEDDAPLGPRPDDDSAAAAAQDAAYDERERREFAAIAAKKGLTGEEAADFVDFMTMDFPRTAPPVTGAELVRRLKTMEPLSDEAADELQEILKNECGQIEWESWDLPAGHLRDRGDDAAEPDGGG